MNIAPVVDPFATKDVKSNEKQEEKKQPVSQASFTAKTIEASGEKKTEAVNEIKNLDFDFGDNDDFFNSFTGPGVTKVESNTFGNEFSMDEQKKRPKKSNKLMEISEADSNPFGGMVSNAKSGASVAPSTSNNLPQISFDLEGTSFSNSGPKVNECTNDVARDKLLNMNTNRKAISSDDLFTDMNQSEEMKERFAQLAGA